MNKLTKFSRAILAIAIMLCVALPTLAHDFSVGGIYYKYLDKTAKTVEVIYKGSNYDSYSNEYTGSVTIPSSVTYSSTTYSVTSISSFAFYDCTGLTSVTIPNSVTTIGSDAFWDCDGLTELNYNAENCTSMGSARYPVFRGCSNLKIINIGSSVKSIPSYAFSGCTGLTSVTIPNSVTSIGDEAFRNCRGLTSVTIPNSVTSIGNSAFLGCSGLASITIPNSVTSIGGGAFSGCDGLTSVIIGNSVTSIGNSVFYDCSGLTSIIIPNSVTSIGNYAFWGCSNLKTVINLSNLTFSKGSSSYGYVAYYASHVINDSNLFIVDDFVFYKENNVNIMAGYLGNSGTILLPTDFNGENYVIGDYAFYYCSGLTSVTIPNSVTEIGNYAFYGCRGLTSITIPNSVTSIGNYAFYWCYGLTSVTIGNSVTSIGDYAFDYCTGLTSITIPNSVTSIGESAFYDCSDLTSITIPNSVTSIGDYTFWGCYDLTSVTIGNSVTSIGDKVFNYCWDLDTIISLNPTPPACSSSESFYDDLYSSATLYVPKDSYAKYFVDEVWGQFTNIKKIEILVSSITLNNSTIELDKGSTATLSATIAPSNATIKNIVWTSSNPQIATVDQSGKVTALSAGTATITAMANDGSNVSASCQVVVKEVETKITLSQTEANLPVNDVMTLSYEVIPLTTPVEWSTSNENVAYVKTNSDGSATIVGVADGVAIITAKALDGSGVSASCVVTVGISGVEGVEMDNNAVEVSRYDIHGRLLSEPTPGINIVKMSNGTTRKEIVKN